MLQPSFALADPLVHEASPHRPRCGCKFIVLISLLLGFVCIVHWGQVPLSRAPTISMAVHHMQPVMTLPFSLPVQPARTEPMIQRARTDALPSYPTFRRGHSSTIVHATEIPEQFKTIEPFGEVVLVKTTEKEEETVGGIIIPTTAVQKMDSGEVAVVGNGKTPTGTKTFAVKPGDFVIYAGRTGNDITWQGEEYKIIKEDQILGTTPARAKDDEEIANLQPINDFMLVKLIQASVSSGGIILSAPPDSQLGEVVRVGGGRTDPSGVLKPLDCKAGDKVLFSKLAGQEPKTTRDGKKWIILKESEILAKVE